MIQQFAGSLIVCLCLVLPAMQKPPSQQPPAQQPSPTSNKAQQTGQTIGTIVSAAVDTAFPVIGKIMDLFAGSKKNASKTDVDAAVKKAQTDFMSAAKQKLQPAATISKELKVLMAFATAGASASENIVNINHLLESASPNYNNVDTEWKIAKAYLADVLTIKPEDIQAVQEPSIQLRLMDLQNSRKDLMLRIDANIDAAKNHRPDFLKSQLESQIEAMGGLLKGFNALAAIELTRLQADIDELAKWANSPAGQVKRTVTTPNKHLLQITDEARAAAKRVLQQH